MARRSDHTREELKEAALKAAETLTRKGGWRSATARAVARAIGYTPGTLYNVFENLDDLLLQMNGRTMEALYNHVTAAPVGKNPVDALREMGMRYAEFVARHPRLWEAVMEFERRGGARLPEWYREIASRLVGLGERAIAGFFAPGEEQERHRHAYVLWTALYGLTSRTQSNRLSIAGERGALLEAFITTYLTGLQRLHGPRARRRKAG